MLKKTKFKKILMVIAVLILAVFVIPIKNNKSIFYNLINNKFDGLSAERLELYDKMRIDYINIKNRVTRTI